MIQVLELHDNTHTPSFATRNGYWENANDFILELAKPHAASYEVREVFITDWYEDLSPDKLKEYFVWVERPPQRLSDHDKLERDRAFRYLWKRGEHI